MTQTFATKVELSSQCACGDHGGCRGNQPQPDPAAYGGGSVCTCPCHRPCAHDVAPGEPCRQCAQELVTRLTTERR